MTTFWTIWISVISLGTIVGCWWLLRWTLANKTGVPEGENMGHEFDGISEINNQLPRWWTILFWITLVWGLLYLALYPGLGGFKGILGWESSNQHVLSLEQSQAELLADIESGALNEYAVQVKQVEDRVAPIFAAFKETSVEDLINNPEAMEIGKRLFLQNCAQCHGSDARGQRGGFPNLTDSDWLYGGTGTAIQTTLLNGRSGAMPGWIDAFGEQGVAEVVAYTMSLSNHPDTDTALVDAGKARFAACAACHGMDGKGNQMVGAPNLTDNIWLYGSSKRAITETLTHGRNGVMPSFNNTLGEEKIHVVASYVYGLSK
ncbi:MAG: cytochrome-c oxidase, cbb3-type subunit III [Pseudomonadota bacterium]